MRYVRHDYLSAIQYLNGVPVSINNCNNSRHNQLKEKPVLKGFKTFLRSPSLFGLHVFWFLKDVLWVYLIFIENFSAGLMWAPLDSAVINPIGPKLGSAVINWAQLVSIEAQLGSAVLNWAQLDLTGLY